MASLITAFVRLTVVALMTLSAVSCISLNGVDDEFDWRTKGVISPVKNQGAMGSVVSVAITEGVESLHAIQTETPVVVLSNKEVEDCCFDESHLPHYNGFDCIPHIGGLCTEAAYKSEDYKCNNASCRGVGKVTKTGYIQANREDTMAVIIHQTPLTAYIDASQASFETYISGIYSDPNCNQRQLDHVVQIVGYGNVSSVDYWIIKNSWGVYWGEKGYMRIVRGKNMCGIANYVFYPINQH